MQGVTRFIPPELHTEADREVSATLLQLDQR